MATGSVIMIMIGLCLMALTMIVPIIKNSGSGLLMIVPVGFKLADQNGQPDTQGQSHAQFKAVVLMKLQFR